MLAGRLSHTFDDRKGFFGDGENCDDIDECILKIHSCSESSMCRNTNGSFTCVCQNGFIRNGSVCVDIDECDGEREEYACRILSKILFHAFLLSGCSPTNQ